MYKNAGFVESINENNTSLASLSSYLLNVMLLEISIYVWQLR
jgi:hypothetical protein